MVTMPVSWRAGETSLKSTVPSLSTNNSTPNHAPCGVGAGMGDETLHGLRGNAFDLLPMIGLDGRRLPGITVIAAFLPLANRFAHHNACR